MLDYQLQEITELSSGMGHHITWTKITSYYMKDMSNIPENKMRKLQIKLRSDWEKFSTWEFEKNRKIAPRLFKRNDRIIFKKDRGR